MYKCEIWTIKKAECRRIDAFELWCWRRLLRVPWTARIILAQPSQVFPLLELLVSREDLPTTIFLVPLLPQDPSPDRRSCHIPWQMGTSASHFLPTSHPITAKAPGACLAWSLDHEACHSESPLGGRAWPPCLLPTSPHSGWSFLPSVPTSS